MPLALHSALLFIMVGLLRLKEGYPYNNILKAANNVTKSDKLILNEIYGLYFNLGYSMLDPYLIRKIVLIHNIRVYRDNAVVSKTRKLMKKIKSIDRNRLAEIDTDCNLLTSIMNEMINMHHISLTSVRFFGKAGVIRKSKLLHSLQSKISKIGRASCRERV